ncbi:hypothetical protein SpCBS45565_g01555 [Spizellomyces sp. 'palustris']|nr:hypothetical protein SpCBS45565_g01555 [Spizellomyces sp. 'palustris']
MRTSTCFALALFLGAAHASAGVVSPSERVSHAFVYSDNVLSLGGYRITVEDDNETFLSESEALELEKTNPQVLLFPFRRPPHLPIPSATVPKYFLCKLPSATSSTSSLVRQPLETLNPQLYRSKVEKTLVALSSLANECLPYTQGWWSYEYCHLQKIRQYHSITGKLARHPLLDYVLGTPPKSMMRYDPSPFASVSLVEFDDEGRHYLRMRWGGGTLCEVTGKPRHIEVQFHCCPDEHISSVREMAVCNYVMIVHTHRVCKLSWFQPGPQVVERNVKLGVITCQPVLTDEEKSARLLETTEMPIVQFPSRDSAPTSKDALQEPMEDSHRSSSVTAPKTAPLELADTFEETDPLQDLLDTVMFNVEGEALTDEDSFLHKYDDLLRDLDFEGEEGNEAERLRKRDAVIGLLEEELENMREELYHLWGAVGDDEEEARRGKSEQNVRRARAGAVAEAAEERGERLEIIRINAAEGGQGPGDGPPGRERQGPPPRHAGEL